MKEEILFLSLLRFLAALSIVIVHTFVTLIAVGYLPQFLSPLAPATQYGYLGVDLFFIISGFVITLSIEGRTAGQFVTARFMRLFPVFWICLLITSLVTVFFSEAQHISWPQFFANMTMSPDIFGAYAYIDGSYWTLAIELKFYFFMAVLLALGRHIKVDFQKVALFLSFLLTIHTYLYVSESSSVIAKGLTFFFSSYWSGYAQYFIAGMLFYGLYQNKRQFFHYPALLLCCVIALSQALNRSYPTNDKVVIVAIVSLFFALFFALSFRKVPNTTFSFLGSNYRKVLITLGAVTYPLYLLHDNISQTMVQVLTRHQVPVYVASPFLFATIVALVLVVNKVDFYISTKWKQRLLKAKLS